LLRFCFFPTSRVEFATRGYREAGWYTLHMTKRLDEVVADVRELSEDEQDRIADAMSAFLSEWQDDPWRVA
jgi:hypothetical protein